MNEWVKAEYDRLRGKGWRASEALRAARIKDAWDDAENAGLVKVEMEPEQGSLDMFEPDFENIYDRPSDRKRASGEWYASVERDGIWCAVAYARPNEDSEWEVCDSCGGFIGDDWKDSGYDTDMRCAALARLDEMWAEAASELAERATYAVG